MTIQIAELVDYILFEFIKVDGWMRQLICIEDLSWLNHVSNAILLLYYTLVIVATTGAILLGIATTMPIICLTTARSTLHTSGLLRLVKVVQAVALCKLISQLLL